MYVNGSGMSQDCARSGTTFICASRAARLENISPSTCSEYASAPIRGSRLVGAESNKKSTVPESAEVFEEPQPTRRNAPQSSTAHIIATAIAGARNDNNPARKFLARVAMHQFPQNRGSLSPSSRRQIIRAPMKRLVSQNRESQSLFRLRRNAKSRRRHNLNPRQSSPQLRHQQRIFRPAPRHDQFIHPHARKNKSPESIRNRERRKNRRGPHQILSPRAPLSSPRNQFVRIFHPKLLAPRRLRRQQTQISVSQHPLQQRPNHLATQSNPRIAIVCHAPPRDALHQRINDHVPRPGIEREYILGPRAKRNHGDVSNSSNVQSHTPQLPIPVQQIIHKRHQRRPLPARGHIRRTKIRNRRDSSARRNNARLTDLQSGSHPPPAQKPRRRPLMKNRLPMRPNQSDPTQRHTPPPTSSHSRRCKLLPQQKIQLTDFGGGSTPAIGKPQDRRAHARRKPHMMMSFEFDRKGRGRARNTHQGNIDPIRRSARHHSQYAHHSTESRSPQAPFTTAISQQVYTLPYVFALGFLTMRRASSSRDRRLCLQPVDGSLPFSRIIQIFLCVLCVSAVVSASLCVAVAILSLPLASPSGHESCFCKAAKSTIASIGVNLFKSAERIASTTEASSAVKVVCCCTGSPAPGESSAVNFSSLCSCLRKISLARAITSFGNPASRAPSTP